MSKESKEPSEDFTKQIESALAELHEESVKYRRQLTFPITITLDKFGSLLGVLSKQASDQAAKAQEQTRKIVKLTWGLFWLTVVLVIFTFDLLALTSYLAYDSYLNRQSYKTEQSHRTEPKQTDTEIHSVTVLY